MRRCKTRKSWLKIWGLECSLARVIKLRLPPTVTVIFIQRSRVRGLALTMRPIFLTRLALLACLHQAMLACSFPIDLEHTFRPKRPRRPSKRPSFPHIPLELPSMRLIFPAMGPMFLFLGVSFMFCCKD